MTETSYKCRTLEELHDIADQIMQFNGQERIFLISGKMGAGKTTLIKALCKKLEVTDVVNSPTFSIVNEYTTVDGSSVYHFDLYRIKTPVELLDIGFEEYIYSGNFCLIEWPEMAAELMPANCIKVEITTEESGSIRKISVQKQSL